MFAFVVRWILWLMASAVVTWWVRYFLHNWKTFENQFVVTILSYTVTYPDADSSSEAKDGKPLRLMELKVRSDDANTDKDIFVPIRSDPNLFIAGFTTYLLKALEGVFSAKLTFFVDSMDAIIMSSNKTDVLVVKFPAAGYDRFIHIDIASFKRWYWIADAVLTMILFVVTLVVVGTGSILGTLYEALKIIVKL